jgi:AraC-like DNA-binding protein
LLDKLLTTLDVRIEAFGKCETCPGWRLAFGSAENPSVHYTLSGSGYVHVPERAPIPLPRDSLLVLPKGLPHTFDNAPSGGQEMLYAQGAEVRRTALPTVRAGDPIEGKLCFIVACGTIQASFGGGLGLFEDLREPLVESFGDQPLGTRFQALLDELKTPSLGTRALTEAFFKEAVVLVLRRQLKRENGSPLWLAAFRDPGLQPAVSAILERPGNPFTLEDLARMTGVSRSVFAERFTAAFGQPPIEFLKHVRLHRAARLLEVTDLPVKVVATSVGYESRSYFSRAFRAAYGFDPTDYRARQNVRGLQASGLALQ